jgi:tRNA splicing endonuclease
MTDAVNRTPFVAGFTDMEPDICDLVRMNDVLWLAINEVPENDRDELTVFAARKLSEMTDALRSRYYEVYELLKSKGA